LGVGLAPVGACDVRGNCVGRGRKQRPTSEEKADRAICKEERRSLDAEPMALDAEPMAFAC
jgi:hypothetical protein